jgi:putative ABC transport system substrate-binding protein
MKRREFITLFGGTAVAWPLAVRAQQSAMPVVGFLSSRAPGENEAILVAFRRGLKEVGYVAHQVAVIVSNGPAITTAKAATSTIPIVFSVGFDPLTFGLVTSLSRPSGNLTGVSILDVEITEAAGTAS